MPTDEATRSEPQPITTYHVREECGGETDLSAPSLEAAREKAEEWIRAGDYGVVETTIWVHGWIGLSGPDGEDPDDEEQLTVAIDPSEPGCRDADRTYPAHDWDEPAVRGHGGGVILVSDCRRCRIRRTADTWAQDPETGEQGLESIRYDRAEPVDRD